MGSERRQVNRFNMRTSLRFRATNLASDKSEHFTEALNISRGGFFFASSAPLQVGVPIDCTLRMPPEVTGSKPQETHCTGDALYSAGRARAERAIRRRPDRFRRRNREIPHAAIGRLPKLSTLDQLGNSRNALNPRRGDRGTPQIRNSGDSDSCFGASDIFESVVGANRDGVLAPGSAPRQTDGEFVALLRSVADSIPRHHDDPVPAVDAILSAVDAASRIASDEVNRRCMDDDTTCLRTAQLRF